MIVDKFGRVVAAGDVITYPVRQGSRMWLSDAIVESVGTNQIQVRDRTSAKQRLKTIKKLETVVRVGRPSELPQKAVA